MLDFFFVELSLSYPSKQITVSHCLHTLRDNNVGTLDLINYPNSATQRKEKSFSCHIAMI